MVRHLTWSSVSDQVCVLVSILHADRPFIYWPLGLSFVFSPITFDCCHYMVLLNVHNICWFAFWTYSSSCYSSFHFVKYFAWHSNSLSTDVFGSDKTWLEKNKALDTLQTRQIACHVITYTYTTSRPAYQFFLLEIDYEAHLKSPKNASIAFSVWVP